MHLSDLSKQDWKRAAAAGAAFGGVASGFLAYTLSPSDSIIAALVGCVLGASLFLLLIGLFGLVNWKLNEALKLLGNSENELPALINIRPFLGLVPVRLGGWAIDAHFAEILVHLLMQKRPHLVVECGSGYSTVVIAHCLREVNNSGRVFSLEHEADYAQSTTDLLKTQRLDKYVSLLTAPLKAQNVNGAQMPWYSLDASLLPDRKIDVLVVDGPPGLTGPMARYPAVPLLMPRLADDCVIVMDDGSRPDEREIAHCWANQLHCKPEYMRGGKGAWILRRGELS